MSCCPHARRSLLVRGSQSPLVHRLDDALSHGENVKRKGSYKARVVTTVIGLFIDALVYMSIEGHQGRGKPYVVVVVVRHDGCV